MLVRPEQGLCDTIQFVRFLSLLVKQGAEVTFLTSGNLARLFRPFAKLVRLAMARDDTPIDLETSLLSLPSWLGTRLRTIPRDIPYLFAEKERIAHWRARIGSHGCKVGICRLITLTPGTSTNAENRSSGMERSRTSRA